MPRLSAAPLPVWAKLLTGLAAIQLIAFAAYVWQRQSLLTVLGGEAAAVLMANGVTDGAARWTDAQGHSSRLARLSGSADAATRARITAQLAARPGIAGVVWQDR
jgi:hypothetical protein